MKNEALYHKTVDILVQAYFNDTLAHGNCYACAVGNIVAANCGFTFINTTQYESKHFKNIAWKGITNISETLTAAVSSNYSLSLSKSQCSQLEKTGYSFEELRLIERFFEKAVTPYGYTPKKGDSIEDAMFKGLMNVIEVLDIIHENNDEEITTSKKEKFIKQKIY